MNKKVTYQLELDLDHIECKKLLLNSGSKKRPLTDEIIAKGCGH
jgi:hypothetical protein